MPHARERLQERTEMVAPENGVLLSGAIAGLVGGIAMAAWMVLCATLDGLDPLSQVEPIGTVFRGPDAVVRGAGDVVYGLALYLAYAAAGGILFAALVPGDFPPGSGALVGVGFAMVLMAFSTALFLPAVNPVMRDHMVTLGGSWVLGYAVYGALVGLGPWLRRRMAARQAPASARAGGHA